MSNIVTFKILFLLVKLRAGKVHIKTLDLPFNQQELSVL